MFVFSDDIWCLLKYNLLQWVLVEYLIRVPDNETEESKLIYQLTGRQKVVSCSSVEKELNELEEFCCQVFEFLCH